MALDVAFTALYSDVFNTPVTLDQFRSELQQYDSAPVIELCAYLNFIHEWLVFQPDPVYESLLIASSFPPQLAEKLVKSGQRVFHRRQCLLIMKEAVRVCRGDVDPTSYPNLGEFGRVFLMANDLFYREMQTTSLDEERAMVLVNWIGLVEYLGSALKDILVRSDRMISLIEGARSEPHAVDIASRFEQQVGVSPFVYSAFCMAILARFIRQDVPKFFLTRSNGLVNWKQCRQAMRVNSEWIGRALSPEQFQRCAAITAADLPTLATTLANDKGLEDFTAIRTFPLLRTADDFTLLDSGFLVEKPETGVFWTVQSLLPRADREKSLAFWGQIVERYVTWLLVNSADCAKNIVSPVPKYAASGEEVTDCIVRCGRSAVFVECKGGFFNASAKYSGDPKKLQEEVQRKLIENVEGSPKGARQLANAINNAFGKSPAGIREMDMAEVESVFPLLVVRDDIGAAPTIGLLLAKEFEGALDRASLRVHVHPLVTVSVRVVEFICRYLSEVGLADLLLARINADPHLYSPYWLVPNEVVDPLGMRNNSLVDGEFWRVVRQLAKFMFPEEASTREDAAPSG